MCEDEIMYVCYIKSGSYGYGTGFNTREEAISMANDQVKQLSSSEETCELMIYLAFKNEKLEYLPIIYYCTNKRKIIEDK